MRKTTFIRFFFVILVCLAMASLSACAALNGMLPGGNNGGNTDGGNTDGGNTDGGNTDGGNTDGGNTDGGNTDGGNTDDGNTDGGNTDGGNTEGGNTDGGNTDDGNTDGGNTNGGNTDGGNTDGGEVHKHSFGEWYGNTATCTEGGIEMRDCTDSECDYSEERATLALGHDEVEHGGAPAICTEPGYKAYVTCARDNCKYTTYESTPATGHSMGEWHGNTATCTEGGVEVRDCVNGNCEHFEEQPTEALGHNYVDNECTRCHMPEPSEGLTFVSNGDQTCYVSGIGDCKDGAVAIPEISPDGLVVTGIGENAFSGISDIHSVYIPATVTRIGDNAFAGCRRLVEVVNCSEVDISCTSYGLNALEVHGGESRIQEYENYLFYLLNSSVYLVGYVGDGKNISLPESYKGESYEINKYAFYGYTNIKSVLIPNGVTAIGIGAFEECTGLNSVDLPYVGNTPDGSENNHFGYIFGATDYNSNSEYVPSSLVVVDITGGSAIAGNAFYGCTSVLSVSIPDSVSSIGTDAFSGCIRIFEVVNNSGVEVTMSSHGLRALEVHDGESRMVDSDGYLFYTYAEKHYLVGYIGDEGELSLPESYGGGEYSIRKCAFYKCSHITDVVFSENVTSIGDQAFYECTSLKNAVVSLSVERIARGAFEKCTALESITLPFVGNAPEVLSSFGYIFGSNSYTSNSSYVPDTLKHVIIIGDTKLRENAFYGCEHIERVEIAASVTVIGSSAFRNCTCLESVIFAEGSQLSELKYGAFYGCVSLVNLELPASLKSIADNAFAECTGLLDVSFGENSRLESISSNAFYRCTSLSSIAIPSTVTSVGNDAFYECTAISSVYIEDISLWCNILFGNHQANPMFHSKNVYIDGELVSDIEIPEGVTGINTYAFSCGDNILSVKIPSSITVIGPYAFYLCGAESIEIPSSVSIIETRAFSLCKNLLSIELPAGLTSIGISAFEGCEKLAEIVLPAALTTMETAAFRDCKSIERIAFEEGSRLEQIQTYVFYNCSSLKVIDFDGAESLTEIKSYAFARCTALETLELREGIESVEMSFINCSALKSVTFPSTLTVIGGSAFENCASLLNVVIPDSVTYMGSYSFSGCDSLQSMTLPFLGNTPDGTENTHFGYIFGVNSDNSYEQVPYSLKTVIVTNTSKIGDNAFKWCRKLEHVEIRSSVTEIGRAAFRYCTSLVSVEIAGGTESLTIGAEAFAYCESLESIAFPANLISLGRKAFEMNSMVATSLKEVYIEDIAAWCNVSCDGYAATPLYYTNNLYLGDELIVDLVIPKTVTSIGDYAFLNCENIESVTFEEGIALVDIGNSAFSGCTSLVSIEIPEGVTTLGYSVFYQCTALEDVKLPDSVSSMGSGVFEHCTSLAEIDLPDSLTSIDSWTFGGCTRLESIIIPASVTEIESYAFKDCKNLKSVTFETSEEWWYYNPLSEKEEIMISATDLADTSIVADKLLSYYVYYLHRIEPSES